MIDPQNLSKFRCPIDPKRNAALSQPDETKLTCECCQVHFPIRDGFPILLIDEAVLPEGKTIQQLPCQVAKSA